MTAKYLLIEPGYQVLKRWKVTQGHSFDRQVLKPNAALTEKWRTFGADAVVPIPQRWRRAWRLGGSPAENLARWVCRETQLPLAHVLGPSNHRKEKRQAELDAWDRMSQNLKFACVSNPPQSIILVDDFHTTGRTLKAATQTLLAHGVLRIHAFFLGIRPGRNTLFGETDHSANLLESTRGAIGIGHEPDPAH